MKNNQIEQKGIDVVEGNKYFNIHQWIVRHYGKAAKCENDDCKSSSKKYEWALLKGKNHERNVSNYIQLCVSCHRNYDFTETKRKNMSLAKLRGTKNDKSIIRIDANGNKTTYRSVSEASRLSGTSVGMIYHLLRNKQPKYQWKKLTKSKTEKWILNQGIS